MPLACLSRAFAWVPEPHGLRSREALNPNRAVYGLPKGVLPMLDAIEIEIQGKQRGGYMRRMKTSNHISVNEQETTNA